MIIDDNFLTKEEVRGVEETFTHPNLDWHLQKSILKNSEDFFIIKNINTSDSFQFVHVILDESGTSSEYSDVTINIFNKFLIKNKIDCSKLLRAKTNLTTNYWKNSKFSPHVDYTMDHLVFLYYINDSDGDTILYNEKFKNVGESIYLSEKTKISPVAGRAILFNGRHYHSSVPPEISPFRLVLNIAFIPGADYVYI